MTANFLKIALSVAVMWVTLLPVAAPAAGLELVSRSLAGTPANGPSVDPAVSADGRYVAFTSDASNLVDNDPGSWYWKTDPDVFILDRENGTLENASRSLNSAGYWFLKTVCQKPTLDGSGALAAFECFSGYHLAHRMQFDIYLYDRQNAGMFIVTLGLTGKANGGSRDPALSADGSALAFTSMASNLLGEDRDAVADIYLFDRNAGTLELVSVNASGLKGNGASSTAAVSADGRLVAFASAADNLVAGDINGAPDIFVRDRQTGTVQRHTAPNGAACGEPAISGDGTRLAFSALGTDGMRRIYLVTNGDAPQFVANGNAPALSADGRFLAFMAPLTGTPADTTGVFRQDLASGRSELVSLTPQGTTGSGTVGAPTLSAHGAEVVFASTAADLIAGDGNDASDVFLAEAIADTTPPVVNLELSSRLLWPPNKKLVPIQVNGLATDETELAGVEITLSDEYGSMIGQVVPGFGSTIWLEAWRDGNDMDGRVYTVTAVATDTAGNRSEQSATVVVPHDMRDKKK